MIDLNVIEQAARKPWYCRSKQEDNLLSPEVLIELITRLRQAEKDAARYRWLCVLKIYDQFDSIDQVFYDNKVDTDEAIDEAMQCRK